MKSLIPYLYHIETAPEQIRVKRLTMRPQQRNPSLLEVNLVLVTVDFVKNVRLRWVTSPLGFPSCPSSFHHSARECAQGDGIPPLRLILGGILLVWKFPYSSLGSVSRRWQAGLWGDEG